MSSPELLRETLREVLYGPPTTFGLSRFEAGGSLFSEPDAGLLRVAHAFTPAQALAPAAPGRPSAAQIVLHICQHLEHVSAVLHDPYALRPDEPEAWAVTLTPDQWQGTLVRLARAGQGLYDALYRPLTPEMLRMAHGGIVHAASHAGALHFHLRNVQVGE